jgi:hypothetical protein
MRTVGRGEGNGGVKGVVRAGGGHQKFYKGMRGTIECKSSRAGMKDCLV